MGIPIGSGFDLNAGVAVDLRTKKPTIADRDAILDVARYEGLEVYVEGDAKYRLGAGLTNSDWDKIIDTQSALEDFGDSRYALKNGESGKDFRTNDLEVFGTLILHNEITEYNATIIPIDDAFVQLNAGNTEVDSGIIIDKGADGESRFYNAAADNKWYLTDPLDVTGDIVSNSLIYANDGNSNQWNTAYNHSQITTGNPHNINLADIGESQDSINYWSKTGDNLYYNDGRVGIGTTSPSDKLTIIDNTDSGYIGTFEQQNVDGYGVRIKTAGAGVASAFVVYDGQTHFFRVQKDGKIGIGTMSPDYTLDVDGDGRFNGTITADNFILSSDCRLKENVSNLSSEIVKFNYKNDSNKRLRYGVIAQELQKTNPEMVYEGEDGYLKIAYIDYLVKKVADLEMQIETIKNIK